MLRRRLAVAWVVLGAGGCAASEADPREPVGIVDNDRWILVNGDADSFAALRPPAELCDASGLSVEPFGGGQTLEIETGLCNYPTVAQPSLADVRASELLAIRIWHFDLSAPQPADAFVAVAVDGEPLWETRFPIPTTGRLIDDVFEPSVGFEVGATIEFHVHNHGENTFHLLDIRRLPGH